MSNQIQNKKLYKIGYLFYGSIFADFDSNQIIDGPLVPVRLSGVAFPKTETIKLTRNLHPKGYPTKSSIYIKSTSNIKSTINKLSYREYYDNFDQEPICYFKRKPNNKSVLKMNGFKKVNLFKSLRIKIKINDCSSQNN
jgi:hypothetical protein